MADFLGGLDGGTAAQRDVGPVALDSIVRGIGGEQDRWIVRSARAIRWQHGEHATTIVAQPAIVQTGLIVCRIDIETRLIELEYARSGDACPDRAIAEVLARGNELCTIDAAVHDRATGTIALRSSMHLHASNLDWGWRLLQSSAGLQATLGYRVVPSLAEELRRIAGVAGAQPVLAEHPTRGCRSDRDELTTLDTRLFIPLGSEAVEYAAEELDGCRQVFGCFEGVVRRGHCLRAIIARCGRKASARILPCERHPALGYGLACELSIDPASPAALAKRANDLNLLEQSRGFHGVQGLGAWSFDGKSLVHRTFIPRAVQMPGLAQNLLLAAAARAQRVAEEGLV
ncbi:MAG: hypothetical protein ACKO0W_05490 [Planctomycetota bacterium]